MQQGTLYHEGTDTFLDLDEKVRNLGNLSMAWRNYYYGVPFIARIVADGTSMLISWLPEVKSAMVSWDDQVILARVREVDKFTWSVKIHSSRIEMNHLYHNFVPMQMLAIPLRTGSYDICTTDDGYVIRCPYQTDATKLSKGIGDMCKDVFKFLEMKVHEYEPGKEVWRTDGKPNTEARAIDITWERNPAKKSSKKSTEKAKRGLEQESTDSDEEMPEVTKKKTTEKREHKERHERERGLRERGEKKHKKRDPREKHKKRSEKRDPREKHKEKERGLRERGEEKDNEGTRRKLVSYKERKDPHDHISVEPLPTPAKNTVEPLPTPAKDDIDTPSLSPGDEPVLIQGDETPRRMIPTSMLANIVQKPTPPRTETVPKVRSVAIKSGPPSHPISYDEVVFDPDKVPIELRQRWSGNNIELPPPRPRKKKRDSDEEYQLTCSGDE